MASFHCHYCSTNYTTKQSYERHILTASHLKRTDVNRKMYKCECGKSYLYRQSLYSHKIRRKKIRRKNKNRIVAKRD